VYRVSDGIRLERIVRWTTGDRTISSADVAAERRKLAEPYAKMDPVRRKQFVEPLVSEKRPIADQFPAFASAMAGRDGRIWIREYPRPRLTAPPRWIAFDAEGRFSCTVTVPAVTQLLEFGADYLLTRDRDSVGVERVLQYSIAPPARKE